MTGDEAGDGRLTVINTKNGKVTETRSRKPENARRLIDRFESTWVQSMEITDGYKSTKVTRKSPTYCIAECASFYNMQQTSETDVLEIKIQE